MQIVISGAAIIVGFVLGYFFTTAVVVVITIIAAAIALFSDQNVNKK